MLDVSEGEGTEGVEPSRWRARLGALAVPLFVGLWLAPLPLPTRAHHLAAVFVAVLVLWITEALPIAVTALLIAPVMVVLGITDAKTAFAPYADPLLFLFVGGFMIARSMTRHGLDRRLALALISLPVVRGSPTRVRVAFVASALALSMWVSNTATTAILVPILIGLSGSEESGERGRAVTGSLLSVAYACSIGGLGTPVGSPPNLIAMRFLAEAGYRLTFFDWIKIGFPAAIVMLVATEILLHRSFPPVKIGAPQSSAPRGPWSRGERVTALAFGLAVVGWIIPGAFAAARSPLADTIETALPSGAVALFAASVLFVFRDAKGERVLPWPDAARIDWGIVLLFGGGISLGKQMFETGLAERLANGFVALTGVTELWTLTALVTLFTIFFTEACSNTATSNMLSPLVIAVCVRLHVSPIPPVLAVGLASSCAFMLPIATGPNAIVYGTGRVPQGEMIRAGFVLNVVCTVLIVLTLRVLCPMFGW